MPSSNIVNRHPSHNKYINVTKIKASTYNIFFIAQYIYNINPNSIYATVKTHGLIKASSPVLVLKKLNLYPCISEATSLYLSHSVIIRRYCKDIKTSEKTVGSIKSIYLRFSFTFRIFRSLCKKEFGDNTYRIIADHIESECFYKRSRREFTCKIYYGKC